MVAYIICFTTTILFTYVAEKFLNKNKKKMWIFFSIVAIVIPTFFAGVRAQGVGRDMTMYVINFLELAVKYDFSEYMGICNTTSVEAGYSILVYLISKISSDFHYVLFFIQLIPCLAIYYFAYKNREISKMWIIMLVYMLTLYLKSFTIMRQSIAVGLIAISLIKFKDKKYIKTLIFFVMAYMFHTSAVIAVFMYIIIYVNNLKQVNLKQKSTMFIMMLGIMFIFMLEYDKIIYFFSFNIPILPVKFYNYLSSGYYSSEIEVVKTDAVLKIIYIILSVLLLCQKNRKKEDIPYVLFLVIDFMLFIISFKMTNISRIGYYFFYPAILYLTPRFLDLFKKDRINRNMGMVMLTIILLAFWIYTYPIKKDCETYPYKSDIIAIFNYM